MSYSWIAAPRWRVAAFLAAAAALNYGDRAAMSSVFPALRAEFSLSDTQLGLIGSAFLWSYALASPAAGLIADRWPRQLIVALSLALWSLVTLLTGFAGGLVALVALRAALGAAESLYLPAATALLAAHHGPETRGRAMGLHSVGLNFGVVLGGTFAGYLADHFGWRSGFLVLGISGIALAVVARRALGAPPRPSATSEHTGVREAARYLVRVPSFHVMLAKAMLAGVGVWIFLNWLPLFFRDAFGMSLGAAGFAGTFMLQGATVCGVAAGSWVSDRAAVVHIRHRMLVQGLSYLAAAPFLLLFVARPGFAAVATAVTAFSFFRGVGQANENPVLCEVVPARFRSTAIGIMNTCATAAGGVGVLSAGLLKQALGLNAIFAGISGLFVIAGLALVAAHRWFAARDIVRAEACDAVNG